MNKLIIEYLENNAEVIEKEFQALCEELNINPNPSDEEVSQIEKDFIQACEELGINPNPSDEEVSQAEAELEQYMLGIIKGQ